MMLVDDHTVPAKGVGALDLVEVAVVERVADLWVVAAIGQRYPGGIHIGIEVRRQVWPGHQVEVMEL